MADDFTSTIDEISGFTSFLLQILELIKSLLAGLGIDLSGLAGGNNSDTKDDKDAQQDTPQA